MRWLPNPCGPDSVGAELQAERRPTPCLVDEFRPQKGQPAVAVRPGVFADAIKAATDELVVELAVSPGQVLEAQRLRYRVYCQERGFEVGKDGLERDEFDPASRHVLVRSRLTGGHRQLVGLWSRWRAMRTARSWLRRSGDAGDVGPNLKGLDPAARYWVAGTLWPELTKWPSGTHETVQNLGGLMRHGE